MAPGENEFDTPGLKVYNSVKEFLYQHEAHESREMLCV